jgi:multidrug efflux pump subunit AcrA (membrane-fusion protein)
VVTQGGVFEVGLSFDGRVRRLLTAVGERVEEGQVIAEVEAPTLAIAAAEAQALGSQQRVLAEQRERLAVLVAEGLESRDGLDSVLTTLAELETRRAAGTAILRTAHMQGADRAHLARRGVVRVRAPRAGVLVELMVPEGGAVGISAPLARLVAPSDAVVQVETAQRPPAGPARILTSQGAVTSQPSEGSVMDPATGLFLTFYPLRIPLPHGERVTVRFGVGHD